MDLYDTCACACVSVWYIQRVHRVTQESLGTSFIDQTFHAAYVQGKRSHWFGAYQSFCIAESNPRGSTKFQAMSSYVSPCFSSTRFPKSPRNRLDLLEPRNDACNAKTVLAVDASTSTRWVWSSIHADADRSLVSIRFRTSPTWRSRRSWPFRITRAKLRYFLVIGGPAPRAKKAEDLLKLC